LIANCAGGDTIREICRQSGAHVELNRDQNVNVNSLERVFRITGSPEQMQAAVRLISEKAGIVSHYFLCYCVEYWKLCKIMWKMNLSC
jgi:KH domain